MTEDFERFDDLVDEYLNGRLDDPGLSRLEAILTAEPEARVVINQKTGSIVISGDVTIGDVVVSHKNVVVEAGQAAAFTPVDADQAEDAKLQSLVTALNSIKVPHEDVVEIIKGIAQNGKLHGRLIIDP